MSMGDRLKWLPLVKDRSNRYGIDCKMLDAIIQVESNYDIYAMRFESKMKSSVIAANFAKMNSVTTATEEILEKFSWGLCQIMGSTARWMGFQGPMPLLCDPDVNVNLGAKYLARLKEQHGVSDAIISAYNAGSIRRLTDGKFKNQAYVDKVLIAMQKIC